MKRTMRGSCLLLCMMTLLPALPLAAAPGGGQSTRGPGSAEAGKGGQNPGKGGTSGGGEEKPEPAPESEGKTGTQRGKATPPPRADEVKAWLDSPSGAAYRGLGTELGKLDSRAAAAEIPGFLIVERLAEGASKSVPAARLLQGLAEDLDRFVLVDQLLRSAKDRPATESDRAALLRAGGILLRAGIAEGELATLLAASPRRARASSGAAATRSFAACGAALDLAARCSLSPAERSRIALALARGSLAEKDFGELLPRFAKGLGLGFSTTALVELIESALADGGGLAGIDREMARRAPRP